MFSVPGKKAAPDVRCEHRPAARHLFYLSFPRHEIRQCELHIVKIEIIFISLTDIINTGELENTTTSLNDVSQENATGSCWNTTKYIFVFFFMFLSITHRRVDICV